MSSLQKHSEGHLDSHRHLNNLYKIGPLNLKHRNYSSSKLIKTLIVNQSKSHNLIQKPGSSQAIETFPQKKELKKYCINKFKPCNPQDKIVLKRKNSSLKLFRKEETTKYYNRTKMEDLKQKEMQDNREERASGSLSRETLSQQTIPVKRRVELLKMYKNRPKLQIKDENLEKRGCKGDVSFEDKLQQNHLEETKILSTEKIRSENVLGNGLRKCSSNKIKILVKNPFQRHIKQQQALQEQLNQASIEQIPQLKQSRILQNLNQSFPSLSYQNQLQQLLAMM